MTKNHIKSELAGFSEQYFYNFGLNRKLCSGIKNISISEEYKGNGEH